MNYATCYVSKKEGRAQGAETILLAEDDFDFRKVTVMLLESQGYTVLEAADGLAALKLRQDHAQKVNLLLIDLLMPDGVNGRDLFRELRATRPDLKVIYLSGYSADLVRQGMDCAWAKIS